MKYWKEVNWEGNFWMMGKRSLSHTTQNRRLDRLRINNNLINHVILRPGIKKKINRSNTLLDARGAKGSIAANKKGRQEIPYLCGKPDEASKQYSLLCCCHIVMRERRRRRTCRKNNPYTTAMAEGTFWDEERGGI